MTETYSHQALPAGAMVQEYRIVRVLGTGSFGIVYTAENKFFEELVAFKEFLPKDLAFRTEGARVAPLSSETEGTYIWALQNFLKEAKILWELASSVPHRSIVRVRQFIEANGTAYMVMDYEEGRPLSQILKVRGRLPEKELKLILDSLLDGLERVHAASVWHRDIKPANILLRSDGSPVLIDFGAARREIAGLDRSVMAVFSPAYAAPEQVYEAGEHGPWTDIYALGATLYRATTGARPTNSSARLQGSAYIPATQAAQGSYTPTFLAAIDAALELEYKERPPSITEWRRMFGAHDDHDLNTGKDVDATVVPPPQPEFPGSAEPGLPSTYPTQSRSSTGPPRGLVDSGRRRKKVIVGALAGVVLVAIVISIFLFEYFFPPLTTQNQPAKSEDKIVLSKLSLRSAAARNLELQMAIKKYQGPISQSAVKPIFGLKSGFRITQNNKEKFQTTIDDFFDRTDIATKVIGGDCDLLFDLTTEQQTTRLNLRSNIHGDNTLSLHQESFDVENDQQLLSLLKAVVSREYSFNVLQALQIVNSRKNEVNLLLNSRRENSGTFQVGDKIKMCMTPSRSAYYLLFNVNLDGIYLLFPWLQKKQNLLDANQTYCPVQIEVTPPTGVELVLAIGTDDHKVSRPYQHVTSENKPFHQWSFDGEGQKNAVDLSEHLLTRLFNTSSKKWSVDSRFIKTFD